MANLKRRADSPPLSPPRDEDGAETFHDTSLPDEVWSRVFAFIPNALSTIGAMATTSPCMRPVAETAWAETVDAIDLRHPPIRIDNAVLRTVARRWRHCPNLRALDIDCMHLKAASEAGRDGGRDEGGDEGGATSPWSRACPPNSLTRLGYHRITSEFSAHDLQVLTEACPDLEVLTISLNRARGATGPTSGPCPQAGIHPADLFDANRLMSLGNLEKLATLELDTTLMSSGEFVRSFARARGAGLHELTAGDMSSLTLRAIEDSW